MPNNWKKDAEKVFTSKEKLEINKYIYIYNVNYYFRNRNIDSGVVVYIKNLKKFVIYSIFFIVAKKINNGKNR